MAIDNILVPMLPTIEQCNCTTANDVLLFAANHGLVIYEYSEHIKFVIAIFAIGFVIGIVATKLFELTYRYGKRIRKNE
jgi:hypothetical protein